MRDEIHIVSRPRPGQRAEIDQLTEGNLKNELERHRTLFNTVVGQLKEARLVGNYAGTRAQVVEPPNVVPRPVQPRASAHGHSPALGPAPAWPWSSASSSSHLESARPPR
ncbi:MAG: hypothetical protein U0794_19210 [Isosphaeraceae bacterium]